jgi:cytochrome c-type biogenesis protein
MGMTTTNVSRIIFRYLNIANQFGGVFIGLAGFYLIGLLTFTKSSKAFARRLRLGTGFFLGVSLALAYKPCVTPTLTVITNLCNAVETANIGALMLGSYTLGTTLVILVSGVLLATLINQLPSAAGKTFVKRFCGVVLLTASFLIISGRMTDYKSFLVGRFVPQVMDHSMPMESHEGMNRK